MTTTPRKAPDHEGSSRHHPRSDRLGEELRPHRAGRLHVQGPSVGLQARDPRRRRVDLGRRGAEGQHPEPQRQAQAHPWHQPYRHRSPTPSGPSSPWHRAKSRCSRTERIMAIRSRKPTSPGRRFQTSSDFSEITKTTPEKSPARQEVEDRWPQQLRPQDLRVTAVVATSSSTASSTSSAPRTASPAKVAAIEYDPNRTCRIALLHYADGEKAYILAPRGT